MEKLYSNKYNIVICGDVNVNYLIDDDNNNNNNNNKNSRQLDAVLHSYNLDGIFKFPTRFGLNSHTVIDRVFIDTSTFGKYDLNPLINGLSDHDAQLLILNKGKKMKSNVILTSKEKSLIIS